MIRRLKVVLKNPNVLFSYFAQKGYFKWMNDEKYLRLLYRAIVKKELNLNNPKTFNEKLQWLKLYNRKSEYTGMTDKYKVREYVENKIGNKYLIPLIGVYNTFEEIDFKKLPNQFVLKPNHTSGDIYMCRDKSKIIYSKLEKEVNKWLKRNYFWVNREWSYKNIKPRIICEKFMVDESGTELKDYKVFCFSGLPKMIQVDFNRFVKHKRNLYDIEWNYIDASIQYPNDPRVKIKKPARLNTILELAKVLSKGCPHIRVDFYLINEQIYFGELTFYHGSGYEKFYPESLGIEMGNWIKLPIKNRHFGNMSHGVEE